MSERRLFLALAASLALHAALLLQPLWRLPMQGEAAATPRLEARLLVPPAPAAAEAAERPPRPKKRPPAERAVLARAPESTGAVPSPSPPPSPEPPPQSAPEPARAPVAEARPEPPAPVPAAPGLPVSDILATADQGQLVFHVLYGRQGLIVGRAVHTWKREGERYTLASVTETVGLAALFRRVQVTQVSEGHISRRGLVPEDFRVTEADGDRGAVHFDWAAGRVTVERAGEKRSSDLQPGAQDILSFVYQLVLRHPEGRSTLHVATGKAYNAYELDCLGDEKLMVADKETAVRHYATIAPAGEQTTEVWLAPELAWLPVRVRFTDRKGQSFEMIAYNLDFGTVQRQEPPPLQSRTP